MYLSLVVSSIRILIASNLRRLYKVIPSIGINARGCSSL